MAEKGIIVKGDTTGESVACRDAVELDSESNARVIQRVDVCKGKLPAPFRDVANLIRSNKNTDGTISTGYAAAGVFDNVIVVGDKSTLVVQVEALDATTAEVTIAPILLEDDETTIQGILELQIANFASGNKILIADDDWLTPFLTWDVTGAKKIALAIVAHTDMYVNVDIYGAVI